MDKHEIAQLTDEQIETRIDNELYQVWCLDNERPTQRNVGETSQAMNRLSLLLDESNARRNQTEIAGKAFAKLLVEINRSIYQVQNLGTTDNFVTSLSVESAYSIINSHFNVTFGKIHALAVLQGYRCSKRSELLLERLYEARNSALKAQGEIREAQATEGGAA